MLVACSEKAKDQEPCLTVRTSLASLLQLEKRELARPFVVPRPMERLKPHAATPDGEVDFIEESWLLLSNPQADLADRSAAEETSRQAFVKAKTGLLDTMAANFEAARDLTVAEQNLKSYIAEKDLVRANQAKAYGDLITRTTALAKRIDDNLADPKLTGPSLDKRIRTDAELQMELVTSFGSGLDVMIDRAKQDRDSGLKSSLDSVTTHCATK